MDRPALRTLKPNVHHDHLICERCGRIIEFVQPRIEELQEELAQRYGFVATTHKMEIYGICKACRESLDPLQGRPLNG